MRGLTRVGLCLATAAVGSLFVRAAAAGPDETEAFQLVSKFNHRSLGEAGIQRVTMLLKRGDLVSRRFEIVRIFSQGVDSIRTVVTLLEPASLAGLAYRILEYNDEVRRGEVHLYLPAGTRTVMQLKPSRFFEGLLGADFSYDDLRWRLPEDGWTYLSLGRQASGNRKIHKILGSLSRDDGNIAFPATVLWLDDDTGFLLRRAYYRNLADYRDNRVPDKVLEVAASRCIDGVNTPVTMVMTSADGDVSELRLRTAVYHQKSVDWERLSTIALPGAADWVRSLPSVQATEMDSSNLRSVELCEHP
ncbi:outer membrane lipoprotein-sorting protein [Bradyrhizobium sp. HKCCYLS1011]|uniref:outer membrane lipoprotein-sorting protein n=1 Tax=Bradyrhizobium sp. HKCCYLS1011 TaxID=3420733 RepID=UPI003EB7532F